MIGEIQADLEGDELRALVSAATTGAVVKEKDGEGASQLGGELTTGGLFTGVDPPLPEELDTNMSWGCPGT